MCRGVEIPVHYSQDVYSPGEGGVIDNNQKILYFLLNTGGGVMYAFKLRYDGWKVTSHEENDRKGTRTF